jgi:hypothetical protein
MNGVSTVNIVNLAVIADTRRMSVLRRILTESAFISLSYTVNANLPGQTFTTLSEQLNSAVTSGVYFYNCCVIISCNLLLLFIVVRSV